MQMQIATICKRFGPKETQELKYMIELEDVIRDLHQYTLFPNCRQQKALEHASGAKIYLLRTDKKKN